MAVGSWLPTTGTGTVVPYRPTVARVTAADPGAFLDGEPWIFTITFTDPVSGNPTDLTGSRLYANLCAQASYGFEFVQICDSAAGDGSVVIAPGTGGQATFTALPENRTWTAPPLNFGPVGLPSIIIADVYRQVGGGEPVGLTRVTLRVMASTGAPVRPPAPILANLTLSATTATAGTLFSATIGNQTTGSTLAAVASDGTALTVAGSTITGTFSVAGTPTITLTETLAGAIGSPKITIIPVTVIAPPVLGGALNFSDPANSGLLAAIAVGMPNTTPVGALDFSNSNSSALVAATGA